MNLAEHVAAAFAPLPATDGILVPTATLYPSNGNVVVYVTGGQRTCFVSDRGDALRNARSHGIDIPNVDVWLGRTLRGSSLHHGEGTITTGEIAIPEVFAGIALVARAASDSVRYAIDHYKKPTEAIYERTYGEMIGRFGSHNVSRQTVIAGASHRNYNFDFAAPIGPKMLVLDIVVPNPNAINAKAIAHIDIGNLKENAPFHAIVFDKDADWDASDINLLQSAAQLLPLANLPTELGRYAKIH